MNKLAGFMVNRVPALEDNHLIVSFKDGSVKEQKETKKFTYGALKNIGIGLAKIHETNEIDTVFLSKNNYSMCLEMGWVIPEWSLYRKLPEYD